MGKDLLTYKGIKPILIAVLFVTTLEVVFIILQAKGLSTFIYHLFNGSLIRDSAVFGFLFISAFMLRYLAAMIKNKIAYRYAEETRVRLRRELVEKLFELGPSFTAKQGTASLVTLALEGMTQVKKYLQLIVVKLVAAIVIPSVILIYLFFQDKISSLIFLVTVPIIVVFMILLGLAANAKMEKQWESYHQLSNHFVDSLRGMETLKFLGLSKSHAETIDRVSTSYRKSTIGTLRIAFLSSFALDFFTMLSIASVAVALGIRLINGNLLLDTALLILILAPEYFLPIKEVGADYHATLNGQEAAKAVNKILSESNQSKNTESLQTAKWERFSTIKLSSISYSHEQDQQKALKDIFFHAKGYEKIGIVGASGAGKSTLIDLIGGFVSPDQGTIRINDQLLSSLKTENWRKQVTYIPQHPYIFSDTIAENIRFYQQAASQEEVEKAASAAGLRSLLEDFTEGTNQKIGNGQRALSGGQEQRIALARAFLSKRSILLLDEPTAHVDIETEYELKQTMIPLFKDKLVFFATHRLHWMEQMDRIIVLKDGRIVEVGTQQQLMKNMGEYYTLVQSQLEGVK